MIYFIQSGEDGPIKIGYTKFDVCSRLSNLQTSNPEPLYVLLTLPGSVEDEHKYQEMFADYRLRGEWYKPMQELLDMIKDNQNKDIDSEAIQEGIDLKCVLQAVEDRYIKVAMNISSGNKSAAARMLNITRKTLQSKLNV